MNKNRYESLLNFYEKKTTDPLHPSYLLHKKYNQRLRERLGYHRDKHIIKTNDQLSDEFCALYEACEQEERAESQADRLNIDEAVFGALNDAEYNSTVFMPKAHSDAACSSKLVLDCIIPTHYLSKAEINYILNFITNLKGEHDDGIDYDDDFESIVFRIYEEKHEIDFGEERDKSLFEACKRQVLYKLVLANKNMTEVNIPFRYPPLQRLKDYWQVTHG